MPSAQIRGVKVAGVAAAVPSARHPLSELGTVFGAEDVAKIAESVGVQARYLAGESLCASDLCHAAARRLLDDLGWDPGSVGAILFVSQMPDFPLPATACILQQRLGLSKSCAAFDVGLGCSGYVYGLWIGASLMAASGLSRVLLLAGDVSSRICSPLDRATALLFGDAGTATALERDPDAGPLSFVLGTDGSGWKNLVVPAGLRFSRRPHDASTAERHEAEGGNCRSAEDLFMDGPEIFAFTLREVAPLVKSALTSAGWAPEDVDRFVFHQANKFMLTHLAKRMKLPAEKVPLSLAEYGNTSSASVPLTIVSALRDDISAAPLKLLLAGFGVGYSWGACALTCGPLVVPPIVHVQPSEAWTC
jgi:3-oxoacyl-[acyl-carrier-protein] synthase-3